MANQNEAGSSTGHELIITRVLNAPRQLVFDAFANADGMAQWWGPKGFDLVIKTFDFKEGGTFLYSMQPPNGSPIWGKFIYREIVSPERIELINTFSDESGATTRNPWMPVWPVETLTTFIFTEQDGKTLLTIKAAPHNASAEETAEFDKGMASMQGGWGGSLEKLDDYLAQLK